jgi:AraC-like DNA-binding protein
MKVGLNSLIVILIIFLLVFFVALLIHKGRKQYSNIMLAVYFITQIIGLLDVIIGYSHNLMQFGIIFYPVIFTWGPAFYLFIISLINVEFRFKWKHTFHLIPFLIVFGYTCVQFYFKPIDIRLQMLTSFSIFHKLYTNFSLLFNVMIIGYNVAAFISYLSYKRKAKNQYSSVDQNRDKWLKTSIFGFVIACFITQIGLNSTSIKFLAHLDWSLIPNLAFLAFFIVLFYMAIINKIFFEKIEPKEKYRYSNLERSQALKLLSDLENYMVKNKPFADPALSLKNLASSIGISERHLSQIINEYKKQNFFDFVNSYRVKYAMELLQNPNNEQRTMLDILFESGFNSKTSFNTTFKKQTGLTPSDYKKNCFSILNKAS